MCDDPRRDWMSGDPTSALISGSVTSRSSSCGLRGHFTYTTICGSEMSGMASSEAVRIEYALTSTPAATISQATDFHRMTSLMRRGSIRRVRPLQLVLRVDEEAAERDDLGLVFHAVEDLREQFALHARVNLGGDVLPGLRLDVDDVRVALFDDRLVRDRQ